MKVIVAGGRDYRLNKDDLQKLENIEGITELVSGGASGVDSDVEDWAGFKGIATKQFKPDCKQYGRAAGRSNRLGRASFFY